MSTCPHHWTVTSECPKCLRMKLDEAVAEAKYLREHMENAGGDAWSGAEGHEIRSYLRAILRGPNRER